MGIIKDAKFWFKKRRMQKKLKEFFKEEDTAYYFVTEYDLLYQAPEYVIQNRKLSSFYLYDNGRCALTTYLKYHWNSTTTYFRIMLNERVGAHFIDERTLRIYDGSRDGTFLAFITKDREEIKKLLKALTTITYRRLKDDDDMRKRLFIDKHKRILKHIKLEFYGTDKERI